jgi:tRNA-binding EMAP/Myf-like protein
VVRNLKSRKLAGFASNGMVLCATGPGDNGRVEFVEPPEGAQPGERVRFAGHEGPAAEPNRVDKKKVRRSLAHTSRAFFLTA